MLKENVTRESIAATVANPSTPLRMRPGVERIVDWAAARGVPMIVFTAGLTNVAREVLRQRVPAAASLPIVGNTLNFGGDGGRASSFSDPLVHMFNKNGATILRQV